MIPIFRFNEEYPKKFFESDEVKNRIKGAPLIFQFGAVKKKIGVVRQIYFGRDELFADLVIDLEEKLIIEKEENELTFSMQMIET